MSFIKSLFRVEEKGDDVDRPILALYSDGRIVYDREEFSRLSIRILDKFEAVLLGLLRAVYIRDDKCRKEINYRAQLEKDVRELLDYMTVERKKHLSSGVVDGGGIIMGDKKPVKPGTHCKVK